MVVEDGDGGDFEEGEFESVGENLGVSRIRDGHLDGMR